MRYPPEKPKRGKSVDLPAWAKWKGVGDPPSRWDAVHPETGEHHIVYRSYEDYCMD